MIEEKHKLSSSERWKRYRANHPEIKEKDRLRKRKKYRTDPDYRTKEIERIKKYRKKEPMLTATDFRNLLIEVLGKKCVFCGSIENLVVHHEHDKEIILKNVKLICSSCNRKL
jgi:5-methylcytosine-specific restriction endonuclease McrA